jgi:uncharacterized membrane protein
MCVLLHSNLFRIEISALAKPLYFLVLSMVVGVAACYGARLTFVVLIYVIAWRT